MHASVHLPTHRASKASARPIIPLLQFLLLGNLFRRAFSSSTRPHTHIYHSQRHPNNNAHFPEASGVPGNGSHEAPYRLNEEAATHTHANRTNACQRSRGSDTLHTDASYRERCSRGPHTRRRLVSHDQSHSSNGLSKENTITARFNCLKDDAWKKGRCSPPFIIQPFPLPTTKEISLHWAMFLPMLPLLACSFAPQIPVLLCPNAMFRTDVVLIIVGHDVVDISWSKAV